MKYLVTYEQHSEKHSDFEKEITKRFNKWHKDREEIEEMEDALRFKNFSKDVEELKAMTGNDSE